MISANPRRRADAANARLPASLHARPAAAWRTRLARTRTSKRNASKVRAYPALTGYTAPAFSYSEFLCEAGRCFLPVSRAEGTAARTFRKAVAPDQEGKRMVHQYQLNGYNIVLDTCSGSIHVVDEVAYDIIALFPGKPADEIVSMMLEKYRDREDVTKEDLELCISDVETLKNQGKLYSPDTFSEIAGTFKELRLLFCLAGPLSRRAGADEL